MITQPSFRLLFLTAIAPLLLAPATVSSQEREPVVSMTYRGERQSGLSLLWAPRRCVVLHRTGRLFDFEPSEASDVSFSETSFQPADQAEMRNELVAEFGTRYQVTATPHYLVVHPPSGRQWPDILESLHRSFLQYCGTRGLPLRRGRFPMVAIVFADRAAFLRYSQSDNQRPLAGNVLGYYSRNSNRVAMYDHGNSSGGVSSTIRHEATHQSAFNWGIHSRVSDQPHWIVEGFGTMFEAPGIYNVRNTGGLKQRFNADMLDDFNAYYADHQALTQAIESIVAEDRMFAADSRRAYALAWGMTFYLSERHPQAFKTIVSHYAQRDPFITYTKQQRSDDFASIIGMTTPMLASQMRQFLTNASR